MMKRAAYCFDDELVADVPLVEPKNKKAPCLKCRKELTPHRSGICISCRTVRCAGCGVQVAQHTARKLCTPCGQVAEKKRAYQGLTEDELNGHRN